MHFNTLDFICSACDFVIWCLTCNTLRSVNINVSRINLRKTVEHAAEINILGN